MITIALADNNAYTLKKNVAFFKDLQSYKVEIEATNGHDLILKLNAHKKLPDIILVDINMPIIDGVAVSYYLKLTHPSIKLIGLSIDGDKNSIQNMLLSGADGFVLKASSENVLLEAMETVLSNNIYIDARIKTDYQIIGDVSISRKQKLLKINRFQLTKRERTFVMLNATFLTYEQIAETMFVESKTINSYYDKVSKKFDLHNRHSITIFSLQNGLATLALHP